MKVLITGGCGFLGSNLALSFIKSGQDVYIIDALFRVGSKENMKNEAIMNDEKNCSSPGFFSRN